METRTLISRPLIPVEERLRTRDRPGCDFAHAEAADPAKQRIRTKASLLRIEVLSPEDRISLIQERIADDFAMGVPYVRVLDAESRQAYSATLAEGLREIKSGALFTETPGLGMSLIEVFF